MADLAGLKVSIDGSDAVRQAQQVAQAVTGMGTAGDQAAAKVATGATKMGAAMKEASAAAAASTGQFGTLYALLNKPIGNSMAGVIAAMAEVSRATEQMIAMQKDAIAMQGEMGKGTPMAVAYAEVAAMAEKAAAAMAGVGAEMEAMAAAGAAPTEMMAVLQQKVAAATASFGELGGSSKAAFESVAASSEAATAKTFDQAKAANEAGAAMEAAAAKGRASGEAVAASQTQAATSITRVATAARAEAAAFEEVGAHAGHALAGISMMQRGTDDLSRALGLGMGGGIGFAVRGIEDLMKATAQGGAGMLVFAGSMIAVNAVMKAIQAPLDALKEGLKAFGEEEKAFIQTKDLLGSAGAAGAQLEELKTFTTTGAGSFLDLEDVAKGTRELELLTGQTSVTKEQLTELAGVAAGSGNTFEKVATDYGRVVNAIREGLPIRAQLLVQMQKEGEISAATVVKLENMTKAHADAASRIAVLDAGMKESAGTANEAADSFDGLTKRLANIFKTDIMTPIGAAFASLVEGPMKDLGTFFASQSSNVAKWADEIKLRLVGAFNDVKERGLNVFTDLGNNIVEAIAAKLPQVTEDLRNALEKGVNTVGNAIADQVTQGGRDTQRLESGAIQTEIRSSPMYQMMAKAWDEFWSSGWKDTVSNWNDMADALARTLNQAMTTQAAQTLIQSAYGGANRGGQAYTVTYQMDAESRASQTDAATAQKDAAAQQTDASKAAQEAATKTADNAAKDATNAEKFSTGVLQFDAAIANLIQMMGQGGFAGGFAPGAGTGPTQVLSEWVPGEAMTRANQYGPLGNKLQLGDVALSPDKMQELFGTLAINLKQFVDVVTSQGTLLHQRVADISYRTTGYPNVNTVELYGRPAISGGATVRREAWQPDAAAIEMAKRQRDLYTIPGGAYATGTSATAPKPGPTPPVDQTAKAVKGLTEEKSLTDQLREAEEKYGAQINLVEEQRKTHQISNQAAYQKEIGLYQQEESELDKIKTKLEAAYQAAQQAHDTKKAEEYRMKLVQVETELVKLQGKLQAIGATSTFGGQFSEQLQKNIDTMQFSGTKAADLLSQSLTSVGDAFTSIVDGSAKASDAFKQMVKSILDDILKLLEQAAIAQFMQLLQGLGGGGGGAGAIGGAASAAVSGLHQFGGLVYGPTGTDAVPSRLTAGEYVLTKSAVDRIGVSALDKLNTGRGFAQGGFVNPGTSAMNVPPSRGSVTAGGGTGSGPVNLTTTVNIAAPTGGLAQAASTPSKEDAAALQKMIEIQVRQVVATEKRPGGLLNRTTAG